MATIFAAIASANASANLVNASLARAYQPQSTLLSQIGANLAKAHQAQFAGLGISVNASLARAYQPQLNTTMAQLANTLARAYQPQLNTTMAPLSDLGFRLHPAALSDTDVAQIDRAEDRRLERLSDREIGVMLAVAVFLMVYISFSLVIKNNPQLAEVSAVDGPTPFDAAMAAGAFTFGVWMAYRRSS